MFYLVSDFVLYIDCHCLLAFVCVLSEELCVLCLFILHLFGSSIRFFGEKFFSLFEFYYFHG